MKQRILKRLTALLLAGSMALTLAACGTENTPQKPGDSTPPDSPANTAAPAAPTDGEPVYGGTLTSVYTEFYGEYDPAASSNRCYITFYYDMLWNLDWETDREEFNFTGTYLDAAHVCGKLAEDWTISDDFTSMTVTLRDNVHFQDKAAAGFDAKYDIYGGRQLTASDVKWSFDRLLGLDGTKQVILDQSDWPNLLYMLESVEVVDDLTVTFHFNTANELAVDDFMCSKVNIAGPEWDELTDDQKADWHYANGTGPFILSNYVTDNTMTFTKNPNYWDTDANGNPLPYLDTVELIYIVDTSTALASFISGEVDIVPRNSTYFEADQVTQMAASLSADQYYADTFYVNPMGIGLKQGTNGNEALANPKVREAMQYALDLEALSAFRGFVYADDAQLSDKLAGVFGSSTEWGDVDAWSEELRASYSTYAPEKAKALLAEAGYPDGFEFDVTTFVYLPTELFQLVGEYLNAVGIKMNLTVGNTPPDMVSVGMDPANPSSVFYTLGNTSGDIAAVIRSDGVMNYVHQNNPEIDALVDAYSSTTTKEDQVAAAKVLDQAYMAEHYVLLITYSEMYQTFYRSNFHGLKGANPFVCFGYEMARCWVDAE